MGGEEGERGGERTASAESIKRVFGRWAEWEGEGGVGVGVKRGRGGVKGAAAVVGGEESRGRGDAALPAPPPSAAARTHAHAFALSPPLHPHPPRFGAIYDYELQPATHEKGRTDQVCVWGVGGVKGGVRERVWGQGASHERERGRAAPPTPPTPQPHTYTLSTSPIPPPPPFMQWGFVNFRRVEDAQAAYDALVGEVRCCWGGWVGGWG